MIHLPYESHPYPPQSLSMSPLFRVDPIHPQAELISQAARILQAGGLVAFPTETVYGLGANALEANAVEKIFKVKRRPSYNPLIVHVSSIENGRQIFPQ